MASAWTISLTPVTKDVVDKIAAALKSGGYRSVRQYFSRLRRVHVERTHSELSVEAELALKDAVRSVERGMGGAALKDSFELESLFHDSERVGTLARAIVVIGAWFLLREIELVALRRGHLLLDREKEQVSLTLWASKTDTVGNLVMRTHKCCCSVLYAGVCPYHTALALVDDFKGDHSDPLFAKIPGEELLKNETVDIIRKVLSEHGVALTRPGSDGVTHVQRFGGHVLRVAGAQFLTRLLVPLPTIMLLAGCRAPGSLGKSGHRALCAGGRSRWL